MSDLYTRFDAVFFEKTRLSILTLLYREGTISFNGLKETLSATDGGLYAHLEKLKQAGYVERHKQIVDDTVSSQYSLTATGKARFREYVEFLESVLKSHAENQEES